MGSIAGNRGLRFESVVFLELSHRQLVFFAAAMVLT